MPGKNNRRDFIKKSVLGGSACALSMIASCTETGKQIKENETVVNNDLNFVFVLVDDLGWTDLSCFGSTFYDTPNIDKVAAQGMKFTDAYAAAPVCSPTRASIMTGKYPARLNLTEWIPGFPAKPSEKLIQAPFHQELPHEEITIAEMLKQKGYVSASMGKWHLGDESFLPEDQGFDLNVGGTIAGYPGDFFFPDWKQRVPLEGKPGEYLTDHLTDHAVKFIDDNQKKPFFLYLTHYAVHTPIQGKNDKVDAYRKRIKPGSTHNNAVYAAMIESVDESVGRVIQKLSECGIDKRTVIIITSDNGGLSTIEGMNTPATSNSPLRAGKGHVYEGGIRVPLIISWPGEVTPGSISTEPVISNDFFPTIREMAGIEPDPGSTVDGTSLVPLLRRNEPLSRDAIYFHYPHYSPQFAVPAGAIRQGDFKLVEFFEDNRIELYNLSGDIGEKNNLLLDEHPYFAKLNHQKAQELHVKLKTWRKEVGARMASPNPDYRSR
ncbi:sulfatase [Candidatus Latescibacterota bacterium]